MTAIIGTETVCGVEFAVEKNRSSGHLVGHCWAADEITGQVYGLVEEGMDLSELKRNWELMLQDCAEHLLEEHGVVARFTSLGWDYHNPPPGKVITA